jgi:hypothetical protein
MAARKSTVRQTDGKGRVTLPRGFANSTLLIEVVSSTELRVRKAKVVPLKSGEEPSFAEDEPIIITGTDRDAFIAALDNPPAPTDSLKRALAAAKAQRS